MDEGFKYYIRNRFHYFFDLGNDNDKLIVTTEEINPLTGDIKGIRKYQEDFNSYLKYQYL